MKNGLRVVKISLIALCICYSINFGLVQQGTVLASDACVTRPGGLNICDCTGDNCGKQCSVN